MATTGAMAGVLPPPLLVLLLLSTSYVEGRVANQLPGHAAPLTEDYAYDVDMDYALEETLEGLQEFRYDEYSSLDAHDAANGLDGGDGMAQATNDVAAKKLFTLKDVRFSPTHVTLGEEDDGEIVFRGKYRFLPRDNWLYIATLLTQL